MTKKFVLLSAMMFLQFFMLPVWFVPILPYVQSLDGGAGARSGRSRRARSE